MVIKQAQLAACDSGDPIAVSVTGVQSYPMVFKLLQDDAPGCCGREQGRPEDLQLTCVSADPSKQAVARN